MSTEFQWSDLSPYVKLFKWIFKGIVGVFKAIAYLISSISSNAPAEDADGSSMQSDEPCGVVFGKQEKSYIVKPEEVDGHALVVGGVGSGKSSCIAIPTLWAWKNSVFAIDIKGELYEKTKNIRPNIKVFNPTNENSYGYDPYYFLKQSHNKAQEARAIAQAIIPLPPDIKDPFWIESAQSLFTGAILHFFSEGYSFIETLRFIQSMPQQELIQAIYASDFEEARYYVASFLVADEKTLSGIVLEISRNILPFITDRNLISCFSKKKNLTPADLEYGSDIYIQLSEHLLRQWKNLLTLIVSQFLTYFEQRSEESPTPILFLLDEFPRLGKVGAIIDGLATLRSKKITICLIIQSLAQLDLIYGTNERKVIADTCSYKAILSATDAETQEYFSRLVGTYDKEITSYGTNSSPYIGVPKGQSTNTYEQEKRIIKPEEFATLSDIVLLTPFGTLRVEKDPYYKKFITRPRPTDRKSF